MSTDTSRAPSAITGWSCETGGNGLRVSTPRPCGSLRSSDMPGGLPVPRGDDRIRRVAAPREIACRRMALGTVLLTGAAGGIGSHLRAPLREQASELRITDIAPLEAQAANEVAIVAALVDEAAIGAAADGADAVVHLGGIPSERAFADILGPNV